MIQKTYGDYQKDPATGQYRNMGDRVLTVTRSDSDENILIFDNGRGSIKPVRVIECGSEFTYQIKKKHINAHGGAAGLYEFLEREAATNGGGFFLTVCNKVFDYMN